MKRNRIFFLLTALTLTLALAAMAQAPGRPIGQGQRGPAVQGPLGGPQFLVRYLELTEEQIVKWRSFQEQARTEIAPLAELRKANGEKIREALESGAPNATAIGELVIKNHAIGEQIRGIHEAAQAKFVGILTPEQKAKYDKYLELLKSMPRGGHGEGFGEGAGGPMGFGPGQGGGFGGGGNCPWCQD
ncbi:MAG TPA: Spy/CpxP family protein refolding chaperone [Thermoanaerobaculia bacterium]|nr:Spy/CpxP family protein refolding chaperone [Thermoanaerobaculia bacterium]